MAFKAGSIYGEAVLDTKKWDSGLSKMSKGVGTFVTGAAAAFVAGMTVAIKAADDFQQEMSNVSTVIDTSVISTQDMTKELLKLDPALGSATELTEGLYNAYSAGAETMEEAIQVTTDAAQFAGAALTDNATAVDLLTTAVNAYGKENISTSEASDIFFNTIKEGKITGEELASTIGQSIPLYASMGVEMEELSSGLATMTKQGVSASESTTQLNGLMNSFLKPSEDMAKALADVGYESGAAFIEAEGLTGALEFLEEATGGSKDELAKLLPETSALKGAMALTGTGGEEFKKVLDSMGTAAGATSEAFGKQEKTFVTLENQMANLTIVVGNIGKHFVDDLAAGATTAAGAVVDFLTSSNGMQTMSNIIASVAGAFNAFKTIAQPIKDDLIPGLKEIVSVFTDELGDLTGDAEGSAVAFDALGITSALLSAGFQIVTKAISVTITNLGNLIEAITESGATIGTFFDFLTRKATWDDVKDKATVAKTAFEEFGKGVSDGFLDVSSTVTEVVNGFTDVSTESSRVIETSFKTSYESTRATVEETYDEIITGQENMVSEIETGNDNIVTSVESTNDEIIEDTKTTTTSLLSIWDKYIEDAEFSFEGMMDTVGSTISSGLSAWSDISSLYYETEENKIDAWEQDQLDTLEDTYSQGLLTEEEYEAKKTEIEEEANDDRNEIGKQAFENEKALSIATVWVDAAAAIAGFWAASAALGPIAGPIFGGVMSAAMLTMAGVQTSLINEQTYVPAYAEGGMASGVVQVNEEGGEIISLPDGSQVIPNDISQQIAANSGGHTVNVNFYDTQVASDVDVYKMADEISYILGKRLRSAL